MYVLGNGVIAALHGLALGSICLLAWCKIFNSLLLSFHGLILVIKADECLWERRSAFH